MVRLSVAHVLDPPNHAIQVIGNVLWNSSHWNMLDQHPPLPALLLFNVHFNIRLLFYQIGYARVWYGGSGGSVVVTMDETILSHYDQFKFYELV